MGVVVGDMKLEILIVIFNFLKFDGVGYVFLVSDVGKIFFYFDFGLVLKIFVEVYFKGVLNIVFGVYEVEFDGSS